MTEWGHLTSILRTFNDQIFIISQHMSAKWIKANILSNPALPGPFFPYHDCHPPMLVAVITTTEYLIIKKKFARRGRGYLHWCSNREPPQTFLCLYQFKLLQSTTNAFPFFKHCPERLPSFQLSTLTQS